MVRVAQQRHDLNRQALAFGQLVELTLDRVKRQFGHLEQDQAARRQAQDLAAQLGADGAARTGDQHTLAADARPKQVRIRRHGIAPQQIADIDLTQLVDVRLAGDQVGQMGERLHVHAQLLQSGEHFAPPAPGSRRHCKQDPLDIEPAHQVGQQLRRVHPEPVDVAALKILLVVDEGHRLEVRAAQQYRRKPRARIPRAVNSHPGRRFAVAGP